MDLPPPEQPTPKFPASLAIVFYAFLGGGAALVGTIFFDLNVLIPFPEVSFDPANGLLWGAGVGLATVLVSRVLDRFFEWSRALTRMLKEILGPITRTDALILAVASSVGEELLFRGLLLPKIGLIASSLLFGLVHGVSPGSPGQMMDTLRRFLPLVMAATVMGFAFGWLVEYTGDVLAAVVAHFTINFLNLSQMYRTNWSESHDGDADG